MLRPYEPEPAVLKTPAGPYRVHGIGHHVGQLLRVNARVIILIYRHHASGYRNDVVGRL